MRINIKMANFEASPSSRLRAIHIFVFVVIVFHMSNDIATRRGRSIFEYFMKICVYIGAVLCVLNLENYFRVHERDERALDDLATFVDLPHCSFAVVSHVFIIE